MEIEVIPEELKKTAAIFMDASSKCIDVQRRLDNCTQNLLQSCSSKGISAFGTQYKLLNNNLFTYREILKIIAQDLASTANAFEKAERP